MRTRQNDPEHVYERFFSTIDKLAYVPVTVALVYATGQVILAVASLWFLRPCDDPTIHVQNILHSINGNSLPYWIVSGAFLMRVIFDIINYNRR